MRLNHNGILIAAVIPDDTVSYIIQFNRNRFHSKLDDSVENKKAGSDVLIHRFQFFVMLPAGTGQKYGR